MAKAAIRSPARRWSRFGLAVQMAAFALLAAAYVHAVLGDRYHDQARTGRDTQDDSAHQQPLMDAIARGDVPRVWRMLDDGASANSVVCSPSPRGEGGEGDCESALARAARFGHASIVKLLIERGGDVTARYTGGRTARDVARHMADGCRETHGIESGRSTDRCRRYAEVLRVLEQAESPPPPRTKGQETKGHE